MRLKKKVLIACDSSRTLLAFRGKLIEALVENNRVYVFTPKVTQAFVKEELDRLGVVTLENNLNGSNVSVMSDLRYIRHLYKVMAEIKPDVFFPYTLKPVIYGSLLANFAQVKLVTPMLTGLGYNFADKLSKNSLVKRITRTLLKLSLIQANRNKRLILQNKDDYQTLLQSRVISKKYPVHVVNGSGVDLSYHDYSDPETSVISFLMVARLINAKGINEYYQAAQTLKSKYPQVQFKLIGSYDDNIDSISPSLYEDIKSGKVLDYIGLVDDVRPYVQSSSILVLPSFYGEGVPRCILEGMAMGRPVITSDSVGCRETVNPNTREANGILVPIKDVASLTSAMEYFIKKPDDIVRFGLNGRKYAFEKFDVHKVNRQMLEIMNLPKGEQMTEIST